MMKNNIPTVELMWLRLFVTIVLYILIILIRFMLEVDLIAKKVPSI